MSIVLKTTSVLAQALGAMPTYSVMPQQNAILIWDQYGHPWVWRVHPDALRPA